jgi:SAM-dependent methyltransferase
VLEREGHRVVTVDPERAGALPCDDESFDSVLLGRFLAEWTSRERPLAEARRVLRPGGRLIVAVPYAGGTGNEEVGVWLGALLGELAEFSVKEIATTEGGLCLLAERGRRKSGAAAVWRMALGVAEERLTESEKARVALEGSVAELRASHEREAQALADARGNVERLETALAAALHRRDLEQERGRLAGQGVVQLEQRLERLKRDADAHLEASERRLSAAQLGVETRDRELERLRAAARDRDRKLAIAEARLEEAQQRAERYRASLITLREGRAYRLMRVLWRLRRPFGRAPRAGTAAAEATPGDDADSTPPSVAAVERTRPARRQGDSLRVASILDEMSAACFGPECDLVPLTLEGWREQLDERQPDLLLVESAWKGNGGEWQYRIARYPRKDLAGLPALRGLLEGCRERGIPTVFWNKEDPVHFDRFAEAASLFDHVFTTDSGCVERYRALPGERTVEPLPFAAQPRIHNPASVVPERSASPCFAGAWYRDRHPDRRRALEALLDAARPHGLVIYDRRFGGERSAYGFPDRFAPHVLGNLPYERVLDVYKSHRVFLNANSVADSPTMCSRRVLELAACDTAILSTPGVALAALLGEGLVAEAGEEGEAALALERLLEDEAERARRTRAARRAVFSSHTYAERLATIVTTAGLDASPLRRRPFAPPGESTNGAGAAYPWLLALQPGVTLTAPALADLAAAASFAEADVIGAHPAGNGDAAIEHRLVHDLDPGALLLRRDLVEARGPLTGSPEQVGTQLRRWSGEGVRLYAADADLLTGRKARPVAIDPR